MERKTKTFSKRQNEITSAALELIAESGIKSLTIRNLARSIGITEAAIYRHFSGKNEIIRALILRFDETVQWQENLRGWDAIRRFAMNRVDLILKNPSLAHVFFSEEIFQDDEEASRILQDTLIQHKKALVERFKEALEDGRLRQDASLEALPCIVYGPVRLLIKHWGLSGHAFNLKKRCTQLLDTLEMILQPSPR